MCGKLDDGDDEEDEEEEDEDDEAAEKGPASHTYYLLLATCFSTPLTHSLLHLITHPLSRPFSLNNYVLGPAFSIYSHTPDDLFLDPSHPP